MHTIWQRNIKKSRPIRTIVWFVLPWKIPDNISKEAEIKHISSDVAFIEIKLDSNCIIKSVDIIKLGKLESFNQHVSALCKEFEQYIFENKLEGFYSCGEMKCSDWNNLKMPIKLSFK